MLDTNADSWATLPEILIQLVAIASVTQEPYFEKHCWVNFRQTNNYCTYTGVFILSFSGVLRIPKGWRRVHISRSWEACSFPLIHSGRPSYLLYVLDFDKIFLVFYRLCINKPESETLKIISFSFLSSEWKWLHQHLILHRTLGGGKPTQGFFFFWFRFSARSFRYVDFKDGGAGRGCFYFSNAGSETTSNLLMYIGFPLAGSGFYVSHFCPNSCWKTATHILALGRCIWKQELKDSACTKS